ncbi:MAG: cyclic nucleotide-binding domain-containing protein, partial [Acidobacteriia bacterium]|nr:cyclic nucleotide-binding domain-containing protein [Terriglobia bacterium]
AFAPGEALCIEGEPGDEVFVLLSGEVEVLRGDGAEERRVGGEKAGGVLGEMAVLDPAPRAATVRAGAEGTRVLCLGGDTFREALGANPSVARGVIRALAQRLRGTPAGPAIPKTPPATEREANLTAVTASPSRTRNPGSDP